MKKLILLSLLITSACSPKFKVGDCVQTSGRYFHLIKVSASTLEGIDMQTNDLGAIFIKIHEEDLIYTVDCSIVHEVLESWK